MGAAVDAAVGSERPVAVDAKWSFGPARAPCEIGARCDWQRWWWWARFKLNRVVAVAVACTFGRIVERHRVRLVGQVAGILGDERDRDQSTRFNLKRISPRRRRFNLNRVGADLRHE